jgi:hypothetical protein
VQKGRREQLMTIKKFAIFLGSALSMSGCVTNESMPDMQIESAQIRPESEEIERLQMEVHSLKGRVSALESMVSGSVEKPEPIIGGEGWKSLASWRSLKTGMGYESVKKILGAAHRVDGGKLATWYYRNGGRVIFYEGQVDSWHEPRQ